MSKDAYETLLEKISKAKEKRSDVTLVRFKDYELERLLDFAAQAKREGKSFNQDLSKLLKYLMFSSLDKRSYDNSAQFERLLIELLQSTEHIRRVGVNLNSYLRYYHQGKIPNFISLNGLVEETSQRIEENMEILKELFEVIHINN